MNTGIAGSDLGTEMEVLKSRALREDAAKMLGLQVGVIGAAGGLPTGAGPRRSRSIPIRVEDDIGCCADRTAGS